MRPPLRHLLLLLLSALMLLSCMKEEASPLQKEVRVIAQLKIGPSIEYGETPMSRAEFTEKGIYAINVFWKGKGLSSFQPYASGLFDDVKKVQIGIIEGYEYRFDCTFLQSNELPYDENGKYGLPFSLNNKGEIDAPVTNKLNISIQPLTENREFHQLIYKGATQIREDSIANRPPLRRYYGTGKIDFRSASENPIATIELKRAYCTLRFTTTKELKKNDLIKITTDGASSFDIVGPSSTSDERVLTMGNLANIGTGDISPTDQTRISVYYLQAGSSEWRTVFENHEVTLQRNKKNILKLINIDNEVQSSGDITFSEGAIGELPIEENQTEIQ